MRSLALLFISLACASLAQADEAADTALIEAATHGDLPAVKKALESGARLDPPGTEQSFNGSALVAAASRGHADVVKFLIAKGANINSRASIGFTALTGAIYAGHYAVASELLAQPSIDPMTIDMNADTVFEYFDKSRGEAGPQRQALLDQVKAKIASMDERHLPERYLVVNFVGFGGGGRLYETKLESQARIDKVFPVRRDRGDIKELKQKIENWMRFDQSQGGPRSQTIIIVGSSWGSAPSTSLAKWFSKRFGVTPALHVLIDGATVLGLPYGVPFGRMGPAQRTKNYHIEGFHWPRGAAVKNAQQNINLGNIEHNDALAIGAMRAVDDILQLHAENVVRCAQPLETKK